MDRGIDMSITISKFQPLMGGLYLVLPRYISDKNVHRRKQIEDDNCLRWALRFACFFRKK